MENTVALDTVRTNLDRLTKQTSTGELPLLAQLEDAIFPSGESGGGGRGSNSAPASLAVLDLMVEIRTDLTAFVKSKEPLKQVVEGLYKLIPGLSEEKLEQLMLKSGAWCSSIVELLNPIRATPLPELSCPICAQRDITRFNLEGEMIREPAMWAIWQGDRVDGVDCRCCTSTWKRDEILNLVSPDVMAGYLKGKVANA